MAITKVGAMTDPPVAGDYAILQAKLDAYAKQVGNQGMILTQWTNTIAVPKIAMGSYITHGGTLFVVDTEDFAVSSPAGDGTYYLKVAASGDTLAVSWVASLSGYTWNAIYNGLYHSDESQILPYQLVKAGAIRSKRKITNLMQGSGFVTVDYLGAITGSGPIVATSLDTGHGAMTFDQGVKTTDSPLFQALVYKSVLLYLPNITYGNVLTMFTSGTVNASRTSAGSSTVSGPVETIDWSSLNNVNSENGIESVSLYADMSVTKDNFSTYTVEVLIDGVSEYTRTASNDDTFLVYEILPMTFLQSHTIQIKVTINFSSSGGTGTRTATARVTGRINRGFDAFESMFI